jgi:hypothetical protein
MISLPKIFTQDFWIAQGLLEKPPKPKKVHITHRIPRHELELGMMTPGSYSLENLRDALLDHLSRSEEEYTEIQLRGIREFKERGTYNLSQPHRLEEIRKFYDIFNDVFFNGLLVGKCPLAFVPSDTNGPASGLSAVFTHYWTYYQGRSPPYRPGWKVHNPQILICLKDNWCRHRATFRSYLDSLVHEMLHAYFGNYACRCDYGCDDHAEEHGVWKGHYEPYEAPALLEVTSIVLTILL